MSINTERFDVLHNFISPVTGRILADPNYVLVGNPSGIAVPSPILIDIRLEIIKLKQRLNKLVEADFIIGHPNNEIPEAQVLVDMGDGFLYNTNGTVSTTLIIPIGSLPDLPFHNIWIGDVTNRPVPQQRVDLLNLTSFDTLDIRKNFGIYNLYRGELGGTDPSDLMAPETTLRLDMSNLPIVKKGRMLIGKRNYSPAIITIDTTFPFVHASGLNWNPPSLTGGSDAVLSEIALNPGEIFIGDPRPGHAGEITTTTSLPIGGLPNLTYKRIWRGNPSNRPVEVDDLTILEGRVDTLDGKISGILNTISKLTSDLLALQFQVGGLEDLIAAQQLEIDAIAGSLAALGELITGILFTLGLLGISVTKLRVDVDRLLEQTLDQIHAPVANVNMNNHKIINLANPTNPLDAVNLQTLTTTVGTPILSVLGTANQITASTVLQVVTLSLPTNVIIGTSVTAGNLKMDTNTLSSINTNGDVIISPNGTGRVDVNTHRIINLSNPVGVLDAVNLQTLNAAIATTVLSVVGTTNQITASTVSQVVTLSLPSDVIITTSVAAGNLKMVTNTLQSTNTNGDIIVSPNGTGRVDINTHRIINVSNPVGSLDAVNLQTLNTAIGTTVLSVSGTTNQITASTVSQAVTLSLPTDVIITTSVAAGNLKISGNTLQSTNTNGDVKISPNGTGRIDADTHKIINVSNPSSSLDAVNLQTLNSSIATTVLSVSGTANQITASTVSQAVTLSLPSAVVITTSVAAGNLKLDTNTFSSTNSNGNILITPNGTGKIGMAGTPTYFLDIFGTSRTQRLLGNTTTLPPTVTLGATNVVGTGATNVIQGSETAGRFALTTGTGPTIAGTIAQITLVATMPSSAFSVIFSPADANSAGIKWAAISDVGSNSFSLGTATVLAASTTYIWNYMIAGW